MSRRNDQNVVAVIPRYVDACCPLQSNIETYFAVTGNSKKYFSKLGILWLVLIIGLENLEEELAVESFIC